MSQGGNSCMLADKEEKGCNIIAARQHAMLQSVVKKTQEKQKVRGQIQQQNQECLGHCLPVLCSSDGDHCLLTLLDFVVIQHQHLLLKPATEPIYIQFSAFMHHIQEIITENKGVTMQH